MKTMRDFSILGMAVLLLLGIMFCGMNGAADGMETTVMLGWLAITFISDALLSCWQLHLNDEKPEATGQFMKRFGIYAVEKVLVVIVGQCVSSMIPRGMADLYSVSAVMFIFAALEIVSALIMFVVGFVRTKFAQAFPESHQEPKPSSGKHGWLRNVAVFGMFAVSGIVMLLTERNIAEGINMILYIVGLILAVVLTGSADYLLSVWQLHLRKKEREGLAVFGKRYLLYLAEKAVVILITMKNCTMITPYPVAGKSFSASWFCFAAAMCLTAVIVLLKGFLQNVRKTADAAA